jgi:hypothetical protein
MTPPKILDYATMFKKLKKNLFNSTSPLLIKKQKKTK